jgi:hypothetical protein
MDETTFRNLIGAELPDYGTGAYNGLAAYGASRPASLLGTDQTSFVNKLKNLKNPWGSDVPTTTNPTTPGWVKPLEVAGTLGLGLASFLDQRKTAGLQRDALRQNLQVAREHQASRKAVGDSWNKAWGQ